MSSESNFAYSLKYNTHFIVKNITGYSDADILAEEDLVIPQAVRSAKKVISVFNYPINPSDTRDLLQIPGVQEEDIRSSLLKGQLRHKFLCGDIALVSSNIDLLQFSDKQRAFLFKFGFNEGVQIGWDEIDGYTQDLINQSSSGVVPYLWRQNIDLIGLQNGINRTFFTPEFFLDGSHYGNIFSISVFHNGRRMAKNIEYTISESGGPGTGFNTINFISFPPISSSTIRATYAIKAP